MQKVIVVGDGIGRAGIIALAEKGLDVVVVDRVDDVLTQLVKADFEPPIGTFLVEDSDRHMKNSPYPAKKRGKGKRNKY